MLNSENQIRLASSQHIDGNYEDLMLLSFMSCLFCWFGMN